MLLLSHQFYKEREKGKRYSVPVTEDTLKGRELQHGLFRAGASQGWALVAAPTSTAVLLRTHFKSLGFKEKGIDLY